MIPVPASEDEDGDSDMRTCLLSSVEPEWERLTAEKIMQFGLVMPTSVTALIDAVDDFGCLATIPVYKTMKVAPYSFAKGRTRSVSKAREVDDLRAIKVVVYKEALSTRLEDTEQQAYENALARHRAASFLALEFNKATSPHRLPQIRFVDASMCQMLTRRGKPYFVEEELVVGAWEKYNSGSGVAEPSPSAVAKVDHLVVQAFSHWTLDITNGKLVVVGCQGAFNSADKRFSLANPVVHCLDETRFTPVNAGAAGVTQFTVNHRCNPLCTTLSLRGFAAIDSSRRVAQEKKTRDAAAATKRLATLPSPPPLASATTKAASVSVVSVLVSSLTADAIRVSTKSGTKSNMLSESKASYWESNGSRPHWVEITVPPDTDLATLKIHTHDHDSYSPRAVSLYAGATSSSLVKVKDMSLAKTAAWVDLLSAAEAKAALGTKAARVLKFEIRENHDGGCDSRVSCLKLLTSASTTGSAAGSASGATRVIESRHPYSDDADDYEIVAMAGATGYTVTFDDRSSTEEGYDYLV